MSTAATQVPILSQILTPLLQVLGALILGIGSWAVSRFVQWLNLKNSAQVTAIFDDALNKSVTYGLQQAQDTIRANGWDHIDVRNQTVAEAANYMIGKFPDALRAVGLNPSDPQETDLRGKVTAALERAFPAAAANAAASPATPPVTAPNPPVVADLGPPANH